MQEKFVLPEAWCSIVFKHACFVNSILNEWCLSFVDISRDVSPIFNVTKFTKKTSNMSDPTGPVSFIGLNDCPSYETDSVIRLQMNGVWKFLWLFFYLYLSDLCGIILYILLVTVLICSGRKDRWVRTDVYRHPGRGWRDGVGLSRVCYSHGGDQPWMCKYRCDHERQ